MKKRISIGILLLLTFFIITGFASTDLVAKVTDIKLFMNGKQVQEDVMTINGTSYLPLRSLAELLGLSVEWNGEKRQIVLEDGDMSDAYAYYRNGLSAFNSKDYNNAIKELEKAVDMGLKNEEIFDKLFYSNVQIEGDVQKSKYYNNEKLRLHTIIKNPEMNEEKFKLLLGYISEFNLQSFDSAERVLRIDDETINEMTNNDLLPVMRMFTVASEYVNKDNGVEIIIPQAINESLERYLNLRQENKNEIFNIFRGTAWSIVQNGDKYQLVMSEQ